MRKEEIRVGMTVKMSGCKSKILVLSKLDNYWFKGRIIDLCGSQDSNHNYVGHETEFNIDFAIPC